MKILLLAFWIITYLNGFVSCSCNRNTINYSGEQGSLQHVIDEAPSGTTIFCDAGNQLELTEPLTIRKALTLKGLNARLPEKLGRTSLIVVEAEGVNLFDLELHGNYDTVDQIFRAPLIEILKGGFRIERCKFYDSSREGIKVSPKIGSKDIVGGIIRDIEAFRIGRDAVSISGDEMGLRVRDVTVEDVSLKTGYLKGAVEVSDGTDNIRVSGVYAEDCAYALDIQDHLGDSAPNTNIDIEDVTAVNCTYIIRSENSPRGHINLTLLNLTAKKCEAPVQLSNTKDVTIEGLTILDHKSKWPPISLRNCHGVTFKNLTVETVDFADQALHSVDCSDINIEGMVVSRIENTVIEQWDVYELVLNGPASGNPYMDAEFSAVFECGQSRIEVPGFYDGDGRYRVRFSPHIPGIWTYQTESNRTGLSGIRGEIACILPDDENHGPVNIVNTHYLQYTDGTPYYAVGTTAYQWTSVSQKIQSRTVNSLLKDKFNKIRMCFFPKWYKYGNHTEPWTYPFKRDGEENDFSKPNYGFFQNFDRRILQLLKMGIEADVILFHPYDAWGYSEMGKEMNEKYVRYMIARLSAYRNVWWSLANEWDVPRIKDSIDWEGIGILLQREDPHHRLRGIHNWYGSEDHFYDHSRPWITHASLQTSQFYNAIKWRERYKKPLLFDEMRYEGDVPSGWGRLTGEEMTSYFWMAGLSGGYGTHGDTFQNEADDSTEVRWWAKGGELVGESPVRIRFFKSIMEQAPVHEMAPAIIDNGDAENLNTNTYILSKPEEYYLAYTAGAAQTIEINLTGVKKYQMDVIDTWNMKIIDQASVDPGRFKYRTISPYTILRFHLH